LKVKYFEEDGWEKDEIETAKKLLLTVYKKYESKSPKENNVSRKKSPKKKTASCIDRHIFSKLKGDEQSEIDKYLSVPVVDNPEDGSFNLIEWWSSRQSEYPILASIARDYLAIPATSAFVERVFSRAGRVLTDERQSLKEGTVRQAMCLDFWMRRKRSKPVEVE
jgi:hypothetical protein